MTVRFLASKWCFIDEATGNQVNAKDVAIEEGRFIPERLIAARSSVSAGLPGCAGGNAGYLRECAMRMEP
jgi:hypothetical protein